MPMITNQMFQKLGEQFGIEPALLKSVAIVECGTDLNGFLIDGKPKILFEGHIFYKEYRKINATSAGKCLKSHPTICYEKWTTKYYLGGMDEWDRYREAASLNEQCAMLATSWGFPQIMGFNHKACGCNTVEDFVDKMKESEESQMKLWYHFLYNNRLIPLLKEHNWEEFTKKYNGPGQVDRYSQKLINTYNNLKGKV